MLGWPPRRAEHWGAALGCRVGAWHGQLGSGGNRGFGAPVPPIVFPLCHSVYVPNRLPPCPQPARHTAQKTAAGPGTGCPHACARCSQWCWCCEQGKPGLTLRAGAVPVEPRPAGPGTVRGSVALGGRARERLVLVCKNTEVVFFFFFLAVFCRQQQGSVNMRLSQQASRSLLAERDGRRGEITVHVWSYRS